MKAKSKISQAGISYYSFVFSKKDAQQSFVSASNKIENSFLGPVTDRPKLEVGQPNDKYEQEAERVADTVMRMPDSQIQMQPVEGPFMLPNLAPLATPVIQKQTNESDSEDDSLSSSQSQYCNRTLPSSEVEERDQILEDFCRDLSDVSDSFRRVIVSSMCDFSLNQLNMMQEAGLRFWIGSGVPPIFAGSVRRDTETSSASYTREIRTVFLGNRVNPGYLTHEMAHVWDHISNLPSQRRVRLDDINLDRRMNLINNPGQLLSETNQRQELRAGGRSVLISFNQMLTAYNNRLPRRELAFSGSSWIGYSRTSPRDFYAEGYTVFHGNSIRQQAKLYKYARELYVYLILKQPSSNCRYLI